MSASDATCNSISACSKCVKAVNRVQVGRIGKGNRHAVVIFEDGNDAILLRDVARDGGDDIVVNLHIR